ncbi:MAG: hypothetical protein DRG39_01455, partial [Deltaproteobacteria bacterium]
MKKWSIILFIFIGLLSCARPERRLAIKPCVECHQKELKAFLANKRVHAPIREKRCEACHRPHGIIGGVYLKKALPQLCLSCHKKLKEVKGKNIHPPFKKGNCLRCHNPHSTNYKFLLNKGPRVTCLVCHTSERFNQKFVHQPAKDCQSCHFPHRSNFPYLLKKEKDTVCLDCHKTENEVFLKAHKDYHPKGTYCTDCHSPHSGKEKGLFRLYSHQPIKDCDLCHLGPKKERPFSLKRAGNDLCYSCHKKERPPFNAHYVHPPLKEKKCLTCHAPHASDFKGIAISTERQLCLSCHKKMEKKV